MLARRTLGILFALAATAVHADVVVRDPGASFTQLGIDLHAGDVVVARAADGKQWEAVDDPFDLVDLEFSRPPIGPTLLRVRRDGAEREVELPREVWNWRIEATPPAPAWQAFVEARAAFAEKRWKQADAAFARAEKLAGTQRINVLAAGALAYQSHPDRARSIRVASGYVAACRAAGVSDYRLATALNLLGSAEMIDRRLDDAQAHFDEALAKAGGPGARNKQVAAALQNRAFVHFSRSRLDLARRDLEAALAVIEEMLPQTQAHAIILTNVAGLVGETDPRASGELSQRALAIIEKLTPDDLAVARTQQNIGQSYVQRGRYAEAEPWLRRAIDSHRRIAPGSAEIAYAQHQLALALMERGDAIEAREVAEAGLAASLSVSPDSFEVRRARLQLASLAPDAQAALALLDQVVATASDEDELQLTVAHAQRGVALADAGRWEEAVAALLPAIATYRATGRLRTALTPWQLALARAQRELGRREDAAATLRDALDTARAVAPFTTQEAQVHFAIARAQRADGEPAAALASYRLGIACLEAHRDLLGGSEDSRARWAARYAADYRAAIELALELGDEDEAWLLLERYRAQEFLASLGARRDALRETLPEALREEVHTLEDEFVAMLQAGAAPADASLAPVSLEARYAALGARIAAAEPRWEALQPKAAIGRAELAARLAPDQALASYAVLSQRVFVFVATREGTQSIGLSIAPADLARDVDRFRLLLAAPTRDAAGLHALHARAAALHAALVAPLHAVIEGKSRLVIVADGPLHLLPFAALVTSAEGGDLRYLVEDVSLSLAASATTHRETSRDEAHPVARIGIFGAPLAASEGAGDAARSGNGDLVALPGAAEEAEEIAGLYGDAATLHLAAAATPAAAHLELREADIVHFATHAVLDARDPLASSLRLSPDAQGLDRLSAWDVMRAPGVKADLVTLSACESALGLNVGGEGLIGLARAFQFAGVRSVVASLWRVSDRPTQQLMQSFYEALQQGDDRDVALAKAQRRAIADGRSAWRRWWRGDGAMDHPYYWSAFVLAGAPR